MIASLEVGEWSAARPGRTLPPGKTRYPLYRRLGGPQDRSGRAENLVPTEIRFRTVQPLVAIQTELLGPQHCTYHVIIIFLSTPKSSKWYFSLCFCVIVPSNYPHCIMSRLPHFHWCYFPNNIWWKVKIIKFLLMKFPQASCFLQLPWFEIPSSASWSRILPKYVKNFDVSVTNMPVTLIFEL